MMAKRAARNEKPARGASTTAISWREVLDAWLMHHRSSARDSFQRELQAPLQHLLTALVIGITLALPTMFALALQNLQELGEHWDDAPRLSVFVKRSANTNAIQTLQETLQKNPATKNIVLITPAQGLAEFEQSAGLVGTLELLEENPLPPVLAIELNADTQADTMQSLQTEWQRLPDVDHIQSDLAWVKKLFHIMQLGKNITITLAALLGMGALLSIGNTIRLAIENRRTEIVVAKLVGATDAFVRRPFLYSGLWFGLSGGLVAILLVIIGYFSVAGPAAELVTLYQSGFELRGLDITTAASLLLVGVALGMLGAWLAVGQHLHDMRPR
ncbi:MAG TPA: permease-like cell division protein FtsX [Pseudomonadales bacterium]|nr:permease-like cell division protein FtsX [Pseudomonadales bacterium]